MNKTYYIKRCKNAKMWKKISGYRIDVNDMPLFETRKYTLRVTALDTCDWGRFHYGAWYTDRSWKTYRKNQYWRIPNA